MPRDETATEIPPVRRKRGRPRSAERPAAEGSVQSLDRALSLVEIIAETDGATLTDLSLRAGMAPSTTHRLLQTLAAHGFVEFLEEGQRWAIGVEAFCVARAFLRRTRIAPLGRAAMHDLRDQSGETVNLAIREGADVIFITQLESQQPIRACFPVGERRDAHASGIGKALLAELPQARVELLLRGRGLPRFTERTIVEPARFFAEMAAIRSRGYAVDDEERTPGMRCVAAAIFNEYGEAAAGISVSGPAARFTGERVGELGPLVRRAAAAVTRSIGGVAPR